MWWLDTGNATEVAVDLYEDRAPFTFGQIQIPAGALIRKESWRGIEEQGCRPVYCVQSPVAEAHASIIHDTSGERPPPRARLAPHFEQVGKIRCEANLERDWLDCRTEFDGS